MEANLAAKVVFHLPKQFHDNYLELTHLSLFRKIHDLITSRGGEIEVRRRHEALRSPFQTDLAEYLEAENLHIIENGMVLKSNALNTALAYLPPYFHLDGRGVLAESSAGGAVYDEKEVNTVLAMSKFRGLQDRLVKKRRSRYGPKEEHTKIPGGCIAVFLQGDNPHRQGTAYCDNETLLRTVAEHAGDRTVVVKAHPISKQLDDAQLILKLLQEGLPLVATDANIHDILRQCDVTVSYNSAVSIEGFLHNKPAILFGKSDFHHVVEVVRRPDDFSIALEAALSKSVDYAKYVHWYFSKHTLSVEDWQIEAKILQAFERAGFSEARLKLHPSEETSNAKLSVSASKEAMSGTQPLLRGLAGLEEAKLRRAVVVDETYHEFIAMQGREKLRICRHLSPEGAQEVEGRVGEIQKLQQVLDSEQFASERCYLAFPELGLVALNHEPGAILADKIAGASGARRSKFVRMAAEWLQEATLARRKRTELASMYRLKQLKEWSLDNVEEAEDCALLERLLSNLTSRARQVKGMDILQIETQPWFSPENFVFKDDVLCGVNLRSAHWISVSRCAAQFLVDLQVRCPSEIDRHRFGIAQDDWRAYLSIDLVPENERRTALPFFVGEQLFRRFVAAYREMDLRQNARRSIQSFLG